jgi:hypothetical protein
MNPASKQTTGRIYHHHFELIARLDGNKSFSSFKSLVVVFLCNKNLRCQSNDDGMIPAKA